MNHEIIQLRTGAMAMRDNRVGEVMHPVGPLIEAQSLYVEQSKLRERLLSSTRPLVLFDIGLGAGSNAAAARDVSESLSQDVAPLEIVSFENDLESLELALGHPKDFGLEGETGAAARELLLKGEHQSARTKWSLRKGDVLELLPKEEKQADIFYWDMYSPEDHPIFWTIEAFRKARRVASSRATLFTYSASTRIRIAMLLSGWNAGLGASTGTKRDTTVAAAHLPDLATPLDLKWRTKVRHPDVPLPTDAPANFVELVEAHPQFQS